MRVVVQYRFWLDTFNLLFARFPYGCVSFIENIFRTYRLTSTHYLKIICILTVLKFHLYNRSLLEKSVGIFRSSKVHVVRAVVSKQLKTAQVFYQIGSEMEITGGVVFFIYEERAKNIVQVKSVPTRLAFLILRFNRRYTLKIILVIIYPDQQSYGWRSWRILRWHNFHLKW